MCMILRGCVLYGCISPAVKECMDRRISYVIRAGARRLGIFWMGIAAMNSLRCWIYHLGSEYNSTFDDDLGGFYCHGVPDNERTWGAWRGCEVNNYGVRVCEVLDCEVHGREALDSEVDGREALDSEVDGREVMVIKRLIGKCMTGILFKPCLLCVWS